MVKDDYRHQGLRKRLVDDLRTKGISDPAVLPTYLLSKAAREDVTVVLTGEGSDETNAGYRPYLRHAAFAKHHRKQPAGRR